MSKLQKEVRMYISEGKNLDMIRQEVLSSMAYLKATVKETLRLHPPI
uniref:Bx2 n=1 Tax=Arundo donax TaxID=35708 RepID=A0A0A9HDH5_ARUDO